METKTISDAEMQKIEKHIWSYVYDQSYSKIAIATVIWLLRKTNNLTKPIVLFIRNDDNKIANEIHDMISSNKTMQLNSLFKVIKTNFCISANLCQAPKGASMVYLSSTRYDYNTDPIDLDKSSQKEIKDIIAKLLKNVSKE